MKLKWIVLFTTCIFLFITLGALSCGGKTPTPVSEEVVCPLAVSPDGAELIAIPGGTFKMGSLDTAVGAQADEKPQHDVTLTCYNIYKKEVTNKMYAACVAAGNCFDVQPVDGTATANYTDPAHADDPVVGVDFNMAEQYCKWVGGRLPTEAEWEFAALGTKADFTYPWGTNAPDCNLADFKGCQDPASPVAAGSLPKGESPFKLDDMAGNAWEWVFDWYSDTYYASSTGTAPLGPSTGVTKVVRGGSYNSVSEALLARNRHAGSPYTPYTNVGFRCAFGALTVPADYATPNPDKHDVPDGDHPVDGDDPKKPKKMGEFQPLPISCPDGNGNLHVSMNIDMQDPWTLNGFELNNNPYACDPFDNVNKILTCSGPAPAPDAQLVYFGKWCFKRNGMNMCVVNIPFPKPQNCENGQGPFKILGEVDCPINGKVVIKFLYDPDVFWSQVTISYDHDPMNCAWSAPGVLYCVGPDKPNNGKYVIHMEGVYDNQSYQANIGIPVPQNCGDQNGGGKAVFFPFCDQNGKPSLDVMVFPANLIPDSIEVGGELLGQCADQGGGNAHCPIPESHVGKTELVKVCVNGNCFADDYLIPDCSEEPKYSFKVDPFCDAKGVGLKIHFNPEPPSPITKITANGTDLTCAQNSPSDWTCSGLPGQPNDTLAIKIYYQNSPTDVASVIFPLCENGYKYWSWLGCQKDDKYAFDSDVLPAGNDPQIAITGVKVDGQQETCDWLPFPFDCWLYDLDFQPGSSHTFEVCYSNGNCKTFTLTAPSCEPEQQCTCRLLDTECVGATQISMIIQTCAEDPQLLISGSITAKDALPYSCQEVPGFPGRVYCVGAHPTDQTKLALSYQRINDALARSCVISGWPGGVPNCQPVAKCSDNLDKGSCLAAGCKWQDPSASGAGGNFCY